MNAAALDTLCQQIAAAVLQSYAAAYYALEPTQHVARQKVIDSAAHALRPALEQVLRAEVAAQSSANPS